MWRKPRNALTRTLTRLPNRAVAIATQCTQRMRHSTIFKATRKAAFSQLLCCSLRSFVRESKLANRLSSTGLRAILRLSSSTLSCMLTASTANTSACALSHSANSSTPLSSSLRVTICLLLTFSQGVCSDCLALAGQNVQYRFAYCASPAAGASVDCESEWFDFTSPVLQAATAAEQPASCCCLHCH